MTTGRPRPADRPPVPVRIIAFMVALLSAAMLTGCAPLSYARLAIPYRSTELGRSTSLDVLNIARDPAYQFDRDKVEAVLLTQSDTVVGYSGRRADGRLTWLNMIVFNEFRMTAGRKYFFCINEEAGIAPVEPKYYLIPPRPGILFDSEFIIDPEIMTTPYATAEAQKIAIIQWLAERVEQDVAALVGSLDDPTRGGEQIVLAGMMVSQTFTGVLLELDRSPGLAAYLDRPRGVSFPHLSLGEGRIRMVLQNGRAVMTIRVNLPIVPLDQQ